MADPYAIDARYYDLLHESQANDDTGLWLAFAGRTERPVLEVGTGTGRIAFALARAGHRVTALDPSPAMLNLARHKAGEQGAGIEFIEGRVSALALEPGRFGFIVVSADVFLYCETAEEQVVTLHLLGEALAFNGILAIDLPGPALWLDPATNGQPLLAHSIETGAGETLDVWHVHEDDLARQQRALRVTYETTARDGMVRRAFSEHLLRYVYPFEAECLLRLAGLVPVDVYGDYDLGPLTNDSERMIITARRSEG
ncbi:MAG: class I SAM-dependent methyltransferase [Dehalococcoidia bacterium]|nr:MAG: class I SAM-dependent methyltransferase [bacterium]MCE7928019.1 class I SAM-dependent methyltransferase [Chloroflexi bacterium CFX7]MCL4231401.1 methyltransferase domain-containing protein [Dehalococcoidia bacterium]NUQ55117.1 class I SAM-dependent methyltransferase [Dehalococcoidia bacterium]RIL03776.1 MAG: hypothetical protein DCC78_03215 [bacterium]